MIDVNQQIILETQQMLANANAQIAQCSANGFILNKLLEATQKELAAERAKSADLAAKVALLKPQPFAADMPEVANS